MKKFIPSLTDTLSELVCCLLLIFLLIAGTKTSFSQVQITKATNQKTIAGTGGVFMNYSIEFKDKKNAVVEIDSVKTIADAAVVPFYTAQNGISFQEVLLPPPNCKTCVQTTPKQHNLTRGVIMYYRKSGKRSACKVKKFEQLPDITQP